MKPDLKQAVLQTAPTTKAAQLREVMPEIEKKLAAGTQLATIHHALTHAGLDLTFQTLKTYLYRYRKKHRPERQLAPTPSSPPDPSGPCENAPPAAPTSRAPLSMRELNRLMKPDPAEQAEKLARYERLAKQQRRSRR